MKYDFTYAMNQADYYLKNFFTKCKNNGSFLTCNITNGKSEHYSLLFGQEIYGYYKLWQKLRREK